MDYNVIVTQDANKDLDEALDYIANHLKSPTAAKNLLEKVEKIYTELTFGPYIYAWCNQERLRDKGYRKVVVNNYIIIYRVDEDHKTVYILRIFFGRRNYAEII